MRVNNCRPKPRKCFEPTFFDKKKQRTKTSNRPHKYLHSAPRARQIRDHTLLTILCKKTNNFNKKICHFGVGREHTFIPPIYEPREITTTNMVGSRSGKLKAGQVLPGGNGKSIAGHGELRQGSGSYTIPAGTTLVAPRHGVAISDTAGRVLETIDLDRFANSTSQKRNHLIQNMLDQLGVKNARLRNRAMSDLSGVRILNSGEKVQNYTVKSPDKSMKVYSASTTIDGSAPISSIIKPGAGVISLAMCTEVEE